MRLLIEQLGKLEERLRAGGGASRIEKQPRAGKMTARERIAALLDPGTMFLEIGLLIAYDRYDGQAPAAGVVTGLGKIEGRPAGGVANDAPVKAGARWPAPPRRAPGPAPGGGGGPRPGKGGGPPRRGRRQRRHREGRRVVAGNH